ncbi:hypothetical protein GS399_20065 [Pedobacter sp. HMF7647]|uniref:Uncharacterized protein n=1 Tax=Hufsiella arboris TaxID=2695275 RepID=A0A7K1YGT5_9SPHI|nr:hypothetical protein [Hufsiella arboris]MXV53269.1 hypothetical protein [Hufsiella arboris]
MARKKAERTVTGDIIVESRSYGTHTRKPRGTHKPVEINAAFKASAVNLAKANKAAALLKREIDQFRHDFGGGLLWQRMLSVFRGYYKNNEAPNLQGFRHFEIHKDYPLSRLMTVTTKNVFVEDGSIHATLQLSTPNFKRKFVDGYCIGLIAFFADFEEEKTASSVDWTPVIPLSKPLEKVEFILPVPDGYKEYLLGVKLLAAEGKTVQKNVTITGMCCIESGLIQAPDNEGSTEN